MNGESRRFLFLLAAATLCPLVLVSIISVFPQSTSLTSARAFVAYLATDAHVALTAWYYVDGAASDTRRRLRFRFVWMLGILCVGTAVLAGTSPRAFAYFLLGYHFWQNYHYQRQNLGVLAFVSAASTQGPRVTDRERLALELGAVSGLAALPPILNVATGTFFSGFHTAFLTMSKVGFALTALAVVYALVRQRKQLNITWVATLLVTSFFFTPLLFIKSPFDAFVAYAYAHGLQYWVFMSYVSQDPRRESAKVSAVLSLVFLALVIGTSMFMLGDNALWPASWLPWLTGIRLGLVMQHFIIDARVWKLSYDTSREYIVPRFSFLFSRAKQPTAVR